MRVEPGGEVTIFTGISPHGQGQETTFAQIAADYIGADFDKVIVHHGDTGNTPHGNGTGGSRGLAVGGAALVLSLNKIKEKAKRIAAHMLEAAVEDIELADGKYRVKGVPTGGVYPGRDRRSIAYGGSLPEDIDAGLESTDFFKPADETFPFGTHVAVVEVFPETGEVKLLRYVSVDDCGNIISPMLVTGQVHGGLAQGIGLALWEELHYDDSGELLTGTLNDYAVPKADGFPHVRDPPHHDHHADQPARREGHRRGGDDRRDPDGGQRRDRRAVGLGDHPPRYPVHAGEGLEGDPGGAEAGTGRRLTARGCRLRSGERGVASLKREEERTRDSRSSTTNSFCSRLSGRESGR